MSSLSYSKTLLFQKNQVDEILNEKIRLDGRRFDEFRDIQINFSYSVRGQVEVSLGFTRVICLVSEESPKFNEDGIHESNITIHVDYSPMSSVEYDIYPKQNTKTFEKVSHLSYIIESIIKHSHATNTETLHNDIQNNTLSFLISLTILNDDGNVIDASCLAVLGSLMHFRRKKELRTTKLNNTELRYIPTPLCIHHHPLVYTFSVLDDNKSIIVDPTKEEALSSKGEISVAFNEFDEICGIHKFGGIPMPKETMNDLFQLACHKIKEIRKKLIDEFEKHENEISRIRSSNISKKDSTYCDLSITVDESTLNSNIESNDSELRNPAFSSNKLGQESVPYKGFNYNDLRLKCHEYQSKNIKDDPNEKTAYDFEDNVSYFNNRDTKNGNVDKSDSLDFTDFKNVYHDEIKEDCSDFMTAIIKKPKKKKKN